jgi:hypothetical protein
MYRFAVGGVINLTPVLWPIIYKKRKEKKGVKKKLDLVMQNPCKRQI